MPVGCRARACVRSETPCCARGCCCVMSFSPRGCAHPVSGRARLLASVGAACARSRGPDGRYDPHGTRSSIPSVQCPIRLTIQNCASRPAPPRARRARRPWPVSRPGDASPRDRSIGRPRSRGSARTRWHQKNYDQIQNSNFSSEPGRSARPRTSISIDIRRKPDSRLTSRRRARRRGSQQRVWAVSRPRRRTVPRTGRGS